MKNNYLFRHCSASLCSRSIVVSRIRRRAAVRSGPETGRHRDDRRAGRSDHPDREDIARAQQRLESDGFHVRLGDDLFRKRGYLAGSDDVRIDELNAAFRDPEINAVLAGRGGYGTTRILDRLDFDAIRRHPKILLGFSDITALHIAISQRDGPGDIPFTQWRFGGWAVKKACHRSPNTFSGERCWRKSMATRPVTASQRWAGPMTFDKPSCCKHANWSPRHRPWWNGARPADGGNLSLVAALMGTPYEIETRGKILFLEDVGEAPYRVDRMLSTLRLAGKLDELSAAVLGQFTRSGDQEGTDDDTTVDDVLDFYFKPLGVPVDQEFSVWPLGLQRHAAGRSLV